MARKEVTILGISEVRPKKGIFVMLMDEVGGRRKLPILIGENEAKSIIISLQGANLRRPLIYDTTISLLNAFNINIKEIAIVSKEDEIYRSAIIIEKDGEEKAVDSRTSDAVALAVRCNVRIFCEDYLLENAKNDIEIHHTENAPIEDLYDHELDPFIQKAIEREDYERAQALKEEKIKRENQKNDIQ